MPRKARIDAVGALHHIIVRGIERRPIFHDDIDRERFLDRLGRIIGETNTPCYAWVLMTNHVHLLTSTGDVSMMKFTQRLLTGYAQEFNRRHHRHGHVFQNRYHSILCERERYLLALVRYIHLNPLRAGIVHDLDELGRYQYCGHATLIGLGSRAWQDTDFVLMQFGAKCNQARKAYLKFVGTGSTTKKQPDLTGGDLIRSAGGWQAIREKTSHGERMMGDERILGSSDFVLAAIRSANENLTMKIELEHSGLDNEELLARVSSCYQIKSEDLRSRSKRREIAHARAVFCYLAAERLETPNKELARLLNMTPSMVSKAVVRGKEIINVEQIEQEVFKCQ